MAVQLINHEAQVAAQLTNQKVADVQLTSLTVKVDVRSINLKTLVALLISLGVKVDVRLINHGGKVVAQSISREARAVARSICLWVRADVQLISQAQVAQSISHAVKVAAQLTCQKANNE